MMALGLWPLDSTCWLKVLREAKVLLSGGRVTDIGCRQAAGCWCFGFIAVLLKTGLG